ncbi:hypothetical protein A3H10_02535 [Candidatus Uhrbacteria bacterium RIFCSPLOWO2_12_FULL_46_10]|nr:MAG: hypothetical protein A3D60_01655 [Candidatus Uhrbacteria bacterium RIFCSPHIGHO2_02_FULL_47_29]OGL91488.1 MAG: hypothetical protein A3H10_02535 [Candidatus Uhrbacteria bacterium RIFCSPLOWO2_12_FULL_46_10]
MQFNESKFPTSRMKSNKGGMIQWVINHSHGTIATEKQAALLLFIIVAVNVIVVIIIITTIISRFTSTPPPNLVF